MALPEINNHATPDPVDAVIFRNKHKVTRMGNCVVLEYEFTMGKQVVLRDEVELFNKGESPVTMYEKLHDFMQSVAFSYQVVESDEIRALETYEEKMARISQFFEERKNVNPPKDDQDSSH